MIFAAIDIFGCTMLRAQSDEKTWHVLIEPKFMRPEISFPIPGAERTVLVPGWLGDDGELHYFLKKDWDTLNLDWNDFQKKSAMNVTDKKVKAEFSRGRKNVIEYAALTSDDPLTATAVLSPDFLKKFADVFGAKLLVAIPNRYAVYIFPSLASNYQDYAPMIIRAYHATPYPVSLEVFELSKEGGLRAIGAFQE